MKERSEKVRKESGSNTRGTGVRNRDKEEGVTEGGEEGGVIGSELGAEWRGRGRESCKESCCTSNPS
jgi:hypothetical protein